MDNKLAILAQIKKRRQELENMGINWLAFARNQNLCHHTMYRVLSGKSIGLRGEARRVLVALGLKSPQPPGLPVWYRTNTTKSPSGGVGVKSPKVKKSRKSAATNSSGL